MGRVDRVECWQCLLGVPCSGGGKGICFGFLEEI